MKVDLPEPDGPITATIWPASMATDTPRRAWTTCVPSRYSFTRSSVLMSGSMTTLLTRGLQADGHRGTSGHVNIYGRFRDSRHDPRHVTVGLCRHKCGEPDPDSREGF